MVIYSPGKKVLNFYSIPYVRQCLDPEELANFRIHEMENWIAPEQQVPTFFFFAKKLFYSEEGNLICWKVSKKNKRGVKTEYNFKSSIKDFYMTDETSVYFKDKNNSFKFADLKV